jgi:hypothetical protein
MLVFDREDPKRDEEPTGADVLRFARIEVQRLPESKVWDKLRGFDKTKSSRRDDAGTRSFGRHFNWSFRGSDWKIL